MKQNIQEKNNISEEMIRGCKRDIAVFGFDNENYFKFLVSVRALREDLKTVLKFHNSDIEKYRGMFTKKHETIMDIDILNKFRIKSSDNEKQYFTGYFCPKSFWDYVLDYRLE